MSTDPQNINNRRSGATDRHMMVSSKFALVFQHINIAYFRAVSGLEVSVAVDTVKEGGENRYVHYLPSRASSGQSITLERGVMYNDLLWLWLQEIVEDSILVARPIHIEAHENIHSEGNSSSKGRRFSKSLVTWTLEDAIPIKWSGLRFDVSKEERLVNSVTFACKRIIRALGDTDTPLGDS